MPSPDRQCRWPAGAPSRQRRQRARVPVTLRAFRPQAGVISRHFAGIGHSRQYINIALPGRKRGEGKPPGRLDGDATRKVRPFPTGSPRQTLRCPCADGGGGKGSPRSRNPARSRSPEWALGLPRRRTPVDRAKPPRRETGRTIAIGRVIACDKHCTANCNLRSSNLHHLDHYRCGFSSQAGQVSSGRT